MVCIVVKIINNVCSISEEYMLVNVILTTTTSLWNTKDGLLSA
jgi:hypothetical protein